VVSLPGRRLPFQPGTGAPTRKIGSVQSLRHHTLVPKLGADLEQRLAVADVPAVGGPGRADEV
jgi:hypothetical protein